MPPPSPIELLEKRRKALDDLQDKVDNTDTPSGADKGALAKRIADEKAVVDDELATRRRIQTLSQQAANDPNPGTGNADNYRDWYWRNKARQDEIDKATQHLAAVRRDHSDMYGAGQVADPHLVCLNASALGLMVGGYIKPVPKIINKLVSVEILNGYDPSGNTRLDPALGGAAKQWVNLNDYRDRFEAGREALPGWLTSFDGEAVASVDRLSRRVRLRVKFTLPLVEGFMLQMKAGGSDPYVVSEVASNGAYKASHTKVNGSPDWLRGTTDADGVAVVEMAVRTAGGETWTAKGRDYYGTERPAPGSLETLRGLFVCTVTMDGVAALAIDKAKAEFKRQKIHLETAELTPGTGAVQKVPYRRFHYADDRFEALVNSAKVSVKQVLDAGTFKGKAPGDLAPYLVAAHFYDMSPNHDDVQLAEAEIDKAAATTWTFNGFLWDPSDTVVDWFKSCAVEGDNGSGWRALPALTKANFTLGGSDAAGYTQLTLNPPVTWAAETRIRVRVEVRMISGGVNGYSSGEQGQANFVAICRRHSYTLRGEDEMNQTVVHEIGHKVNFTTGPESGTGALYGGGTSAFNAASYRWLQRSATHYQRRGHQGGHCYKNAVENPTYGAGGVVTSPGGAVATQLQPSFRNYDGRCVMFGSGGAGSLRPITFCDNCTILMTRLDIETGWPSL